jgi:hypothetical protein
VSANGGSKTKTPDDLVVIGRDAKALRRILEF